VGGWKTGGWKTGGWKTGGWKTGGWKTGVKTGCWKKTGAFVVAMLRTVPQQRVCV